MALENAMLNVPLDLGKSLEYVIDRCWWFYFFLLICFVFVIFFCKKFGVFIGEFLDVQSNLCNSKNFIKLEFYLLHVFLHCKNFYI